MQRVLQSLYANYINFVFRTTKWERIGFESYEADIARGIPRVLCCWHARLVFTPYLRDWSDHDLKVIASRHADAQIAAENLRRRGLEIIELDTSGENTTAVKSAVRALRQGASLGITVDGPFGPAETAKPGAIVIGALAQVQVAPCTFAISRQIRLKTWDRFIVPLPWSRGVLAVGDGFVPERRMSEDQIEAACEQLSSLIDELTSTAEARVAPHRQGDARDGTAG